MDEGILHSRAERFVRSLEVLPDRWWFDGSNLTLLYGSEFHQVPFPESEQETYLAEDDEFPESVYVNPGDESRSPMEASETLQTEYILVVSICPDYWISDDLATAFQGTMGFIQDLITEEGIDASAISVQNDLENNEIDMIFQRTTDFEGMQQLHRDLTRAVENSEINAYVYAEFAGQLRNDFYPMTYGYPFGRQAMMARTWAAEDEPSVVCRICAAPLDGQTVTCGSKCRSRWVARIPGYAKSVKPRTLDAVFRTIAEADGDWITSSTINSVVADQFRDINISTGHVVNLARLYHNPEFVEMGSSGRGAMFRITGGTGLWDWLRPDLYALIKPDDVDTFESSVVIPPTKTIVERVQAMQEAFRVSEMQSKLIDLQTQAKLGMIRGPEDIMSIMMEAEVREAESATKTLYLGAESDGMAKCSNCDEQGHRKTNCPHPERVKVVYPHILPDFEKWKSGESKMQLAGRIKRNILRIVGNESGIGAHQLVSRYHDNLGTASRTRSEVTRVTRIANAMPEILVWRDGYYLLGPGGKEEFFRTGPGSLKG